MGVWNAWHSAALFTSHCQKFYISFMWILNILLRIFLLPFYEYTFLVLAGNIERIHWKQNLRNWMLREAESGNKACRNFKEIESSRGQSQASAHLVKQQYFTSQAILENWFPQLGLASKKGQETARLARSSSWASAALCVQHITQRCWPTVLHHPWPRSAHDTGEPGALGTELPMGWGFYFKGVETTWRLIESPLQFLRRFHLVCFNGNPVR